MIPQKLKKGDEIRVTSPSRSLSLISEENRKIARERLETFGFKITFSKNVEENDEFSSSAIKSRVADMHAAFKDKKVKAILTVIGGFNCNQLLKYLDYGLIKSNPKIFCGFSDITALQNAIFKKTGLVTYSGPHFSSFGMKRGLDYTLEYFQKCLMQDKPFDIFPSNDWSDDTWYKNQGKRKFIKNAGMFAINPGEAEAVIVGGNLCTLNLLQGTEFMPLLKDAVLFLEDDEMAKDYSAVEFDRNLQSILHLPGSGKIKGLVIGRFQKASKMTPEKIVKIVKTKDELKNIPVIADIDFGHTTPQTTFPIGGTIAINSKPNKVSLKILKH
ncbi:LD-carboxypeptidase [Candidatus Parcubacteria bacterium]|nr:LD-carboxypeptidase [Patescibacteria group bacterium]MCG2693301.1 LD-carboxypeptidase [Candidatus Parcubacteria bacterium]